MSAGMDSTHCASQAVPTGRKSIAQGKERGDVALGYEPQITSNPEGAKASHLAPAPARSTSERH